MEMGRDILEQYRSCKEEIKELDYLLEHLHESENMVGNDVIMDYQKGYPRPQSVVGFDQEKYHRRRERYQKRKEKLVEECEEAEKFVEAIPDSLTRRIFRMYFILGMSQQCIAKKIHLTQAAVSKKINGYFESQV